VYINPVVGVLLGCLVLKEHFTGVMFLGMAVILVGVALLQLAGDRPPAPETG
jgi:drug/metabolite transporter (DMT)-like permease